MGLRILHLAVATIMMSNVAFSVIVHDIKEYLYVRCNDVSAAMNYLHDTLPNQMPMEEKCKRYAVLSSFLSTKGPPRSRVMCKYFVSSDEQLEQIYRKLEANDELPLLYMQAIDGYRSASHIGPPFLELIECLKKIDKPYIDLYLNNPELVLIVDLHKRILQSPNFKIDLRQIDKLHLSKAFISSLKYLFKDNLLEDISQNRDPEPLTRKEEAICNEQRRELERKIREQQIRHPKGRRDPRRMLTSYRHREQERLRKQRLKLVQPTVERTKARERQRKLRERQKLEDEKHPYLAPSNRPVVSAYSEKQVNAALGRFMPEQQSPYLAQLRSVAMPDPSEPSAGQNMPIRPKPIRPLSLVRPMTPYPLFSHHQDAQEASTSSRTSDVGSENQFRTYSYPANSETRYWQSQFDMPALPVDDQFEDVESVLRSFREASQTRAKQSSNDSDGYDDQ